MICCLVEILKVFWTKVLMYVYFNDLMYVYIYDLMYVYINDVMYVYFHDLKYAYFHDLMYVLIYDFMYVLRYFRFAMSPQTHASMFSSITVRTAEFPVPEDVQALMSVATPLLTFKFLDPVECLMRLMTTGPLSADMGNMAFTPRLNHPWYANCSGMLCMPR